MQTNVYFYALFLRCVFMKFLIVLFLFLWSFQTKGQAYRGNIKLLTDTAGMRVCHLPAETSSISDLSNPNLNAKPKANELDSGQRAKAEKRKVKVVAYLLAYSREADGDYHLILMDPSDSSTMIAELPNPQHPAIKNNQELVKLFTEARKTIDSVFGIPTTQTKFFTPKRKFLVTGILFFDKAAHGLGHAPNAAEIHPVLQIQLKD